MPLALRRRFILLMFAATSITRAATPAPTLDHLIGSFDVFDPSGKLAATSTARWDQAGVAIAEDRRSVARADTQKLWFFYGDFGLGWKQLFVGRAGTVREFAQQKVLEDGGVELGARFDNGDGTFTLFRILVSGPDGSGGHRRHLESSRDEGKTWTTVFDYTYRRKQP